MLRRRVVTIPTTVLMLLVVTLLAPVLFAAALVVDLGRKAVTGKPLMAIRLLGMGWIYLAAEVGVIIIAAGQWVASLPYGAKAAEKRCEWSYWLQTQWVGTILAAMRVLIGLRFEVRGDNVITPGPVVVLFRHVSIMDNLLPHAFIAEPAGLRLRWVLKRELLSDPALDIGGNRMPNYFVDRTSDDPETERERIAALGADMGPNDGVLVFPEGTRFSRRRRRRMLDELAETNRDLHDLMVPHLHVLPPKTGGVLALLDYGTDIVAAAHSGFEELRGVREIWTNAPVGRTIRLSFRRFNAADVPADVEGRKRWLFEVWAWVGAEVDELRAAG